MRVTIQQESIPKDVIRGSIGIEKRRPWRFDKYFNHPLAPGKVYVLILCSEEKEELLELEPDDGRDDLEILELKGFVGKKQKRETNPPELNNQSLPKIRFQVDNDGLFTKTIRWKFRVKNSDELKIWRLPLRVKVRTSRIMATIFYFPVALLITNFYDKAVANKWKWQSLNDEAFLIWLLFALGWAVLLGGLIFFLWITLNKLLSSNE